MATTKSSNATDAYVGRRIRMRRLMLKMSQASLGDELGITCQQIQKYEKGTNRVSASRLQQIANVFQVPIPFFFEGAPNTAGVPPGKTDSSLADVSELLSSRQGLALIKAFMRIKDAELCRGIVALVEKIANNQHAGLRSASSKGAPFNRNRASSRS